MYLKMFSINFPLTINDITYTKTKVHLLIFVTIAQEKYHLPPAEPSGLGRAKILLSFIDLGHTN